MQKAKLILFTFALGGSTLLAQTQTPSLPPGQPSAYEHARETYVNAAMVQVQAYRKQIDAALNATADEERERYAEPNRLLKELERLISRLRSAPPSEFDAVKATYERTRVNLDQALGK